MILDKQVSEVLPANAASREIYWSNMQLMPRGLVRQLQAGMVLQLELKPGTGDVRVIATQYKAGE